MITKKQNKQEFWKDYHKMSDKEKEDYVQAVLAAFSHLEKSARSVKIRQAIGRGNIDEAISYLNWEDFNSEMMTAAQTMAFSLGQQAAEYTLLIMIPSVVPSISKLGIQEGTNWFVLDQYMLAYAQTHSAELVVEITEETRMTIRNVMQRTFTDGLTVMQQQFIFQETVGLNSQLANALYNFEENLRVKGIYKESEIKQLVRSKKQEYIEYRAEMIARTETINATNNGIYEGIEQNVRDGFISPNEYGIEWQVTPDDRLCSYCKPLDGKVVHIGEKFQTEIGAVNCPTLHPNCRCSIALAPINEQLSFQYHIKRQERIR